jgi:uncharacterized cupin superfamily protein
MAGGRHLGCSLYEVPAGHAAYPLHWHAANEEAIIILEGQGRLRIGEEEREVGSGHYIALPPGPAHAHQLIALTDLRYYCISTRISPEVVGYPDSGKVGAIVRQDGELVYRGFFRMEDARPYFDGEPRAEKA